MDVHADAMRFLIIRAQYRNSEHPYLYSEALLMAGIE